MYTHTHTHTHTHTGAEPGALDISRYFVLLLLHARALVLARPASNHADHAGVQG